MVKKKIEPSKKTVRKQPEEYVNNQKKKKGKTPPTKQKNPSTPPPNKTNKINFKKLREGRIWEVESHGEKYELVEDYTFFLSKLLR